MMLSVISKMFFFGFRMPTKEKLDIRNNSLKILGAKPLPIPNDNPLDAIYLPALSSREEGEEGKEGEVNQIILFALHKPYQRLLPKNYTHFRKSADVVLWNPSKLTARQYEEDLKLVIERLKVIHPNKKIAIIARCVTVDPTISVAHELNDSRISLILDRGYGNVYRLARSMTVFACLPFIKKILHDQFDCEGEKKIKEIKGKIFFIMSPDDQLLIYRRKRNMTRDLKQARGEIQGDEWFEFMNSDHWTPWNQEIYIKINKFLGISAPVNEFAKQHIFPPSFFRRRLVPFLIKSWF